MNDIDLSDKDLFELLPTISLKNEKPIRQVWLTQKDALIYARNVNNALKKKVEAKPPKQNFEI